MQEPAELTKKQISILLVEDHADTAQVMSDFLSHMGHTVQLAGSVEIAVRMVIDHKFDVIISDVGLPDGNGISLMSCIRPFCNTPSIAVTAFGRDEDIERCKKAGFNLHMTKPVGPEALYRAINSVLREGN